ncbi:MAG: hypothetical protein WBF93_03215, partial [Pirellulales bacterium]
LQARAQLHARDGSFAFIGSTGNVWLFGCGYLRLVSEAIRERERYDEQGKQRAANHIEYHTAGSG